MSTIKDIVLVCSGRYHDIDFARLELLKLLAQHPAARVTVTDNYDLGDRLDGADALISYTCDVTADAAAAAHLRDWLHNGGRWFALHGTNSVIEFTSLKPLSVATPDRAPEFMALLGSQFQGHPPLQDFEVRPTGVQHALVDGIDAFTTNDEIYLCKMIGDNTVLLDCNWTEPVSAFESTDWQDNERQPVFYLRDHDKGAVLYLTLGHCRGHHDMRPLMDDYPAIERCSWDTPEFYELLRRGIRWALGVL
ncbi:MAG: ThuA domain-containing protein [Pseudomonadota bacterium]